MKLAEVPHEWRELFEAMEAWGKAVEFVQDNCLWCFGICDLDRVYKALNMVREMTDGME